MITKRIYLKYMIPRNLQEHLLRVASLAKIILDHWIGPEVNKTAIIQACVFHDIAKPMNFDLAKQSGYGMTLADIENLDLLQKRLKMMYGDDEHKATIGICKEIGLHDRSIKIVDDLEWVYIPKLFEKNNLESLLPIYCDMRIGPKGILSLRQRLDDLKNRTGEGEHEENAIRLENVIANNTSADLNTIHDDQINGFFVKLLKLEIG